MGIFLRIQKTHRIFDRIDIGIIVTEVNAWGSFEEKIYAELKDKKIPTVVVLNKSDIYELKKDEFKHFLDKNIPFEIISTKNDKDVLKFRQLLLDNVPESFINNPSIIQDIVLENEFAVLVTPIDKEAPKGRLILPEVQTIRDILDGNAYCVVTQQNQLARVLETLKKEPKIVVTDSQCFKEVSNIVPKNIKLTSFSILFARFKGDLISQAVDTVAIEKLKENDKILISEACSHHPIQDDIGREKIPSWLRKYTGVKLNFDVVQGLDFPKNLSDYKLVIHCGACMFNRRTVLNRMLHCKKLKIPFTNYGLVISYSLGIFERALKAFPLALKAYKEAIK